MIVKLSVVKMASTVYETDSCSADHLGIEVARPAVFNRGKHLFKHFFV